MSDRKHPAQSTAETPIGWPAGVRPISQDGLDHVGVGDDGQLYWDGKPIVVQKSVTLTRLQAIGAFFFWLAAIVGAIAASAQAVAAWKSMTTAKAVLKVSDGKSV